MAIFQILIQCKSALLERVAGGDNTHKNIVKQDLGIERWRRVGDYEIGSPRGGSLPEPSLERVRHCDGGAAPVEARQALAIRR